MHRRQIIVACLLLGGIVQAVTLARSYLAPLWQSISPAWGRPAIDRGAAIAFGGEVAAYLAFVRERVPEGSTVVIPPEDVDQVLGHVGLMSYFLGPRQVVDCPSGEPVEPCVRELRGKTTFILRVRDFPPPQAAASSKQLIAFTDSLGVYAPRAGP